MLLESISKSKAADRKEDALINSILADRQAGRRQSQKSTSALPEKSAGRSRASSVPEDIPLIPDGDFAEVARRLLLKLDEKRSGQITKSQIARAIENPSFNGSQDAQALAALYKGFDSLAGLSGNPLRIMRTSVSAADLNVYAQISKPQLARRHDAEQMKDWIHQSFSKLDTDNSGNLTRAEFEKALADPQASAADRKMLETVDKYYKEIPPFRQNEVAPQDFDAFAKRCLKDSTFAALVTTITKACKKVNDGQKPEISHDLYADSKNPLKSISPDAIKQGGVGDCYFLATLASTAAAHPQTIKDAIKDNGDNTYTVTFAGAQDNPITIKAPTEAEQGLYNHASTYGLWASVMEKAFGAYCQEHFWRRNAFRNPGGGYTPSEGANGGGYTSKATRLLTGHDADTRSTLLHFQSTIAADLTKAFSPDSPKAVMAEIWYANLLYGLRTANNFHKLHAYSITGFAPDRRGGGLLTIRNPWALGNNTADGTITLPLDKLMSNFTSLTIER
jgi:hypothetical protein